jgi:radical SAM superfamily enzyme YgiQ (UPF0313 family)
MKSVVLPPIKILLISPQTPDTFWSFKHAMRFISKRTAFPPLGLLTVAAMLPDDWELKLVDLNTGSLNDNDLRRADYVMISAMIVHKASVHEILRRCGRFSKRIIAGGPLFTTSHKEFPEIAHFVLGEAEDDMADLVEDIRHNTLRREYASANRPDMALVPLPRWDLIDFRHYASMSVQFSRGCPFDCEFCDIIVMNGRVPRTKTVPRLVEELEDLRQRGWRQMVFIVDDNFIGKKSTAKMLLREIIRWRKRTGAEMTFLTEASLNLADDPELYTLMVNAGFRKVFVGIETPAAESLKECRKLQNCGRDLTASVEILQRAGLEVMGGFIVGFDNDKPDIFSRQFDFIQRSGVATAMVGLLMALPQTRLYHRLVKEGRIEADCTGNNTDAFLNFRPKLNRDFLVDGYRELMKRLYEPRNYYRRIRIFLKHNRPKGPRTKLAWSDIEALLKSIWVIGVRHRGQFAFWKFYAMTLLRRPHQFYAAVELAITGYHFRNVARSL